MRLWIRGQFSWSTYVQSTYIAVTFRNVWNAYRNVEACGLPTWSFWLAALLLFAMSVAQDFQPWRSMGECAMPSGASYMWSQTVSSWHLYTAAPHTVGMETWLGLENMLGYKRVGQQLHVELYSEHSWHLSSTLSLVMHLQACGQVTCTHIVWGMMQIHIPNLK